jgi:hypothetical protein
MPLGRNVEEVIRLIDALQFTEEYGEVCPANWKKGDKALKALRKEFLVISLKNNRFQYLLSLFKKSAYHTGQIFLCFFPAFVNFSCSHFTTIRYNDYFYSSICKFIVFNSLLLNYENGFWKKTLIVIVLFYCLRMCLSALNIFPILCL